MTQKELREAVSPLFHCRDIASCLDMLNIYSEFFMQTVAAHQMDPVPTNVDEQAKIIFQMMMTKVMHLKSVVHGISFQSRTGMTLNTIIDPPVVAGHSRSIYEMTGMFNIVYRQTNTPDQKLILYNLWVHAGLSYRQRFSTSAVEPSNFRR